MGPLWPSLLGLNGVKLPAGGSCKHEHECSCLLPRESECKNSKDIIVKIRQNATSGYSMANLDEIVHPSYNLGSIYSGLKNLIGCIGFPSNL